MYPFCLQQQVNLYSVGLLKDAIHKQHSKE